MAGQALAQAGRAPDSWQLQKVHSLPELQRLIRQGIPLRDMDLVLAPGIHHLDSALVLRDLRHVRLRGERDEQGAWPTIRVARDVRIAFEIAGPVADLTLQDLRIVGSPPADGSPFHTHAIGSHEGGARVEGLVLQRLWIEQVAVGISVGSCPGNGYRHVRVRDNDLQDILGDDTGSGYGIHAACAAGLRIERNRLVRTGRHAIYLGRGGTADILDNPALAPGQNAQPRTYWRSAIAVTRAHDVTLRGNAVVDSRDVALSLERDGPEDTVRACEEASRVSGQAAGRPAMWVNVRPGTVVRRAARSEAGQLEGGLLVESGRVRWQGRPCPLHTAPG